MVEDEMTTLTLKKTTRDRLEKRKVHPRQSCDEVIEELLNLTSEEEFKDADEIKG